MPTMQAIEDYQQTTMKPRLFDRRSNEQRKLARKTSAQQISRSATRAIPDRRCRAETKVAVYNHLVPILEQHHRAQARLHRSYQRVIAALCGIVIVLGLALAL
jgi:hypothetical protein